MSQASAPTPKLQPRQLKLDVSASRFRPNSDLADLSIYGVSTRRVALTARDA